MSTPPAQRRRKIDPVVAAAWIAFLGTVVTSALDKWPEQLQFHRPAPRAEVAIDEPRSGGQSPWCTRVTGTASLPDGKALVIAVHGDQDPRNYFEATVAWDGPHWSATAYLDDEGNKKAIGLAFTVSAVVMDKGVADYLAQTNEPGEMWWSSPVERGLPPTAEPRPIQVSVRRSAERGGCPE